MNRQRKITFLKEGVILEQRTVDDFKLSELSSIPKHASDISVVCVNEHGHPTTRFEMYMIGTRDEIVRAIFQFSEEPVDFCEGDQDRYIYSISTGVFHLLGRELQMVS